MDRRSCQNAEQRGRPVTTLEAAKANDCFDQFLYASTLKTVLGTYRNICDLIHLKPNVLPLFYPKLKANLTTWKAKALWKKFDLRANNKVYGKGKLCPHTRVLIIGAGPCGLRSAIEAQLLGAKVVVVEKRDRVSRNNVLHLWPFVIDDLRSLGAKKFFGKFCAGSIDHISIRQLQCILLKVALLLGVEVHTEVSFEGLIEPNLADKTGWRAEFQPEDHPVSQFEFDVIIGADGKRNTLQGFKRKEFRGKLAIAITANFINKRTEAEARVEEISGVAFIFNQKFFKDLYADTGIDLENIVYYKDDTHYFVMTAKKQSLIEKGVIKHDLADTAKLLSHDNVDREALHNYAREAAEFSTNYKMLDLEFAVNHYGQPDVAMFDFTSMYAAENASRIIERHGYKLLTILVGDSLLEPFWPTGSGCARGFLSSMDAGWAIKAYGSGLLSPLEVLAERESIYRLLAQTTPENLNKEYKSYTLDPSTRYPNLNKNLLLPQQTLALYDTDDPSSIVLSRTPLTTTVVDMPKKRRRRDTHVDPDTLLSWVKEQVREHVELNVQDVTRSFKDGRILGAIINHYRPDLLDYSAIDSEECAKTNQMAFDVLEKEIGIPPVMTGEEMANSDDPDYLTMVSYLTQIYDAFRCEIPHIKHPKLELPEIKRHENAFTKNHPAISKKHTNASQSPMMAAVQGIRPTVRHKRPIEPIVNLQKITHPLNNEKKPRKRKTNEKLSLCQVEERAKRIEEIVQNRMDRHSKRRQQRKMQTDHFLKSMQMLQANCKPDHSEPFEDYSIFLYRQTAPNFEDRVKDLEKKFTYIPDRENRIPSQIKWETDEDFKARIKGMEDKCFEKLQTDKKPKDLMRAIGKIDNTDWNIKEIEKKIIENKLGKNVNKDKEKVPKWSREQFLARQTKMEKQHLERQDSTGGKFAEIDKNIKQLDQKLKEGTIREINQHKVAKITEKLLPKNETEAKPVQKNNSKNVVISTQGNSKICHFCSKCVYLVERLSAEGKFFHRGCFRCQYCHTSLRLGSYLFDRDGKYGFRFYCSQHFGMPGELKISKVSKKLPEDADKRVLSGVAGVDLLDRVQTPERIEFSNLSTGNASSDHEESLSQMDEDEWTDRNFGASAAELGSSEDESSSISDSDSDDEDAYEEALEEPPTKEGTLKWAERLSRKYSRKLNDYDYEDYSSSNSYENTSGDDDSDTATEGEEEIRARELRKQEVRVEPPVVHTDTGTDTEIATDDSSSESSSEVQNSATEISTDSEFAQDDPTPTREVPIIGFSDCFLSKHRDFSLAKKVQVKSTEIQKSINPKSQNKTPNDVFVSKHRGDFSLSKKVQGKPREMQKSTNPIIPTPTVKKVLPPLKLNLTEGYALNRTQSTGGIASKVSLELKKKYLLGESNAANSIQKSGSASTLDSKFKSFHSTISDCQKLLKPASEGSPAMQTFCNKLNDQASPLSPLLFSTPIQNKEFPKADIQEKITKIEDVPEPFQNENEGRPRSPVHETSIIVPQIDWSKKKKINTSTSSSESSSSSDSEVNHLPKSPSIKALQNILPKRDIQDATSKENLPPDSSNYEIKKDIEDPAKSISSEKKVLNQPKPLPTFVNDSLLNQVHSVLHNKTNKSEDNDKHSGRSTPSNNDSSYDHITTARTETELSDWARDGMVSDDYEDEEFDFNSEKEVEKNNKANLERKLRDSKKTVPIDLKNMHHVCSKTEENDCLNEYVSNILNPNLDNIEFMDTGSEASDDEVVEVKNNGYVQFHDEDDILDEDSLSPVIHLFEAKNPKIKATFDEDFDDLSTVSRNTGYCVFESSQNGKDSFGGEVVDLNPADLEKLKEKRNLYENEEDSLLIIEAGTTTEENTCSDSTVKNITQVIPSKEKEIKIDPQENNNMLDKKRLEDKLAQVKKDMKKLSEQRKAEHLEEQNLRNNIEFDQHCQRLQSKVDFNNAKDSIDIRKSRKQSKTDSPPKPDLIQEEKEISPVRSRKEQLEIERDFNKKVIQEMVMTKMKAQNKSLERKKRNRNPFSPSISPSRPFEINRSHSTQLNSPTPDVILTTMPLQKSQTGIDLHKVNEPKPMPRTKYISGDKFNSRPLSVHSSFLRNSSDKSKITTSKLTTVDAFSLPDINKVIDEFATPKAPPRTRNEEAMRTVEKLKEDARARAKLLSDEDLGLSPEDKLARLRQRVNQRGKENKTEMGSLVLHAEKPNPLVYANDTLSKKRNNSVRRSKSGEDYIHLTRVERTKSIPEIQNLQMCVKSGKSVEKQKFFKSDPNLLLNVDGKKKKEKSKDRERRKSITKLFTDLFTKKKDSNQVINLGNKSFLSRISPRAKDKSKELIKEEPVRRMSLSEHRNLIPGNVSPPPIPPLPVNYTGTNSIDYNSDHEFDWKQTDRSSCDTLDQSGLQDGSHCSRRSNRSARKMARQSQLKRHRTAQEIQRKLEEVEVKTRELEQRGVRVEKAVRGEINDRVRDEPELLREWFDLMKEMNELRRYEKELMIRAQELELEDRHSRLQQELKERLDNEGKKSQEDFETEGSIIKEMMEIVAKRDSLSKMLKDLLRYSHEDKEFEEQMLAKGINVTPLMKLTSE